MNILQNDSHVPTPLLADYKLENWLRAAYPAYSSSSIEDPEWKQLTQYAAYHAIHDWHCLHPRFQTKQALTELFERRWTNKVHKFSSPACYWEVKRIVVANLYRFLSDTDHSEKPLMLFETSSVWVQELDTQLSMIVQVMEFSKHSFIIHKFMMEPSDEAIDLFVHLTIVFSYKAFGHPPERLRISHLLSGEQQWIATSDCDLTKSLDYLRLVKDVYMDSQICSCCAGTSVTPRFIM